MILALFASLFLAQPADTPPTPPANGNAATNGASQPVTTEDQAEAAADAVEEAAEAVEEAAEQAGEAAEEVAEAAAEVAEDAAEAAEEAAEERVCKRRNYYDEFGRRRSRKVCTAR